MNRPAWWIMRIGRTSLIILSIHHYSTPEVTGVLPPSWLSRCRSNNSAISRTTVRPFWYERVYLPIFYKVANTPFHIQGDALCIEINRSEANKLVHHLYVKLMRQLGTREHHDFVLIQKLERDLVHFGICFTEEAMKSRVRIIIPLV